LVMLSLTPLLPRGGALFTRLFPKLKYTSQQVRTLFVQKSPNYALDEGVAPVISPKAMMIHYNQFHKQYIEIANTLTMERPPFDTLSPLEILKRARYDANDALLVNAIGNILNHELFWDSIRPGGSDMSAAVEKLFENNFGSYDEFQERFSRVARGVPNSGWVFLSLREGKLEITSAKDGGTIFGQTGVHPLLALDLYEHSYCFDYESHKADYINNWWRAIDWEAFEARLNAIPPDVW